jgi:hypothetical protein
MLENQSYSSQRQIDCNEEQKMTLYTPSTLSLRTVSRDVQNRPNMEMYCNYGMMDVRDSKGI